jgi:hypothetical protein
VKRPTCKVIAMFAFLSACGSPDAPLDWSKAPTPSPPPSQSPPSLHTEGRMLKTAAGAEVRLRGLNVCSFEFDALGANWQLSADGGSALLDVLADPKRWNANVVRLPVNQEWFLTDGAYVERVEHAIDAAAIRNLYVILDVQWERGQRTEPYHLNILKEPTFGEGNTTEAFWLAASGRFANRTNLLFDLINEPHDVPFERLHASFQRLIDNIALVAPQTVIIAGGPNWAHSVEPYRTRPLRGQVLYSAHQYLPYDTPAQFETHFLRTAQNLPVIIGEFDARSESTLYHDTLIDAAEAGGLVGWLPWAMGCGLSSDDDRGSGPGARIAARLRDLNRR